MQISLEQNVCRALGGARWHAAQSTSAPAHTAHSDFRIVNEKLIWRGSKAEVGVRGAAGGGGLTLALYDGILLGSLLSVLPLQFRQQSVSD